MESNKLFFKECHLAGAMYYDLDEVFEELRVGTQLELLRDKDNRFDGNAVAVMYHSPEGEAVHLGFIPRTDNELIAAMLDMGWGKIFRCTIGRICPEAHYEGQIHLKISILKNEEPLQSNTREKKRKNQSAY